MVKALLAAQQRERDQLLAELVRIKGFMPLLMKQLLRPGLVRPW